MSNMFSLMHLSLSKPRSLPVQPWLGLLVATLLSACSVGDDSSAVGGGGNPPPPPPVPEPAVSNVSYDIKRLTLRWAPVIGADSYRLFERADSLDEGTGYVQIGPDMGAGTLAYEHEVFLPARRYAAYILESCENGVCTESPPRLVGNGGDEIDLTRALGYFKASNTGANDLFGSSVAISADGRTLAVGAPPEAGALGVVCAPAEETCAEAQQSNTARDAGAVYVYARSAQGWVPQAYIKAPNAGARDRFGTALALSADGSVLAVGAPFEESSATGVCDPGEETCVTAMADDSRLSTGIGLRGAGAAYVFERSGETWAPRAYVKSEENADLGAEFGGALALSPDGDMLLIGGSRSILRVFNAEREEFDPFSTGAVHVYVRGPEGWVSRQAIYGPPTHERFGRVFALAANGLRLAVSAHEAFPQGQGVRPVLGTVFLFERATPDENWVFSGTGMVATTFDDRFGDALALSADGDTLAVGVPGDASDAEGIFEEETGEPRRAASGAVRVYSLAETGWELAAYIKAASIPNSFVPNNGGIELGWAVALSGDGNTLAAGAPNEGRKMFGIDGLLPSLVDDDPFSPASGAVFMFERGAAGWRQGVHIKPPNTDNPFRFGRAIAMTTDGRAMVVGSPFEDSAATGIGGDPFNNESDAVGASGAAYLY